MPSQREIAERAGVAVSTVSLVLRQQPGVSPKLQKLVLRAQEELTQEEFDQERYAPKQGFKPLTIVVLHATDIYSTSFFRRLLRGIQSAADRFGVQLRLANYLPEQLAELPKHQYLADPHLRPSGVLIIESQQFEALSDYMKEFQIPFVVRVDPTVNHDLPAVGSNEINAGYKATHHLLQCGHRQIAFVGGGNRQPPYDRTYFVSRRLEGYKAALQDYGISAHESWVSLSSDGRHATQSILENAAEVTALMFSTSSIAQGGLAVLAECKLAIPNDVSVIVLDDLLTQESHQPALTAIHRPGEKEGFWAIKLLLDIINEPELALGQYVFDVSLIERDSCKTVLVGSDKRIA